MKVSDIDKVLMRHCIRLAEIAVRKGDAPFGSLIADKSGKILVTAHNAVRLKNDVSAHAEILAMRRLQKKLGKYNLAIGGYDFREYTLYSICEPCPMCAFIARELKFSRIVYAVQSPLLGGNSHWNILNDKSLKKISQFYAIEPEIVSGVLHDEAIKIYREVGWTKYFI